VTHIFEGIIAYNNLPMYKYKNWWYYDNSTKFSYKCWIYYEITYTNIINI